MAVIFYYDVVCPFTYIASHIVESVIARAGGRVHWTPVLLGGLYKETQAPQGKDGSAMDVMSAPKVKMINDDLARGVYRYGLPRLEPPDNHPLRTLHAMRVLCGIDNQKSRIQLSKAFYKAYWQEGRNMEDHNEIQAITDQVIPGLNVSSMAVDPLYSQQLKENTLQAASRGAFGVPSFYVNGQMVFGVDRLFIVERMLGQEDALPARLASPDPTQETRADLTFYFDYSSPWSYLGCEQIDRTISSVHPVSVTVHYVPILLGALFKKIGNPLVPLQTFPVAKQQYLAWEMQYFASEVAGVPLSIPDFFPLRSVLPLRVTLAGDNDPRLIKTLYRAVWRDGRDISDPEILSKVLEENGFSSQKLLQLAQTQPIKDKLFANTNMAVETGLCGVPSYQVNGGPVIWGQDKLSIVSDMLCGWTDYQYHYSKL